MGQWPHEEVLYKILFLNQNQRQIPIKVSQQEMTNANNHIYNLTKKIMFEKSESYLEKQKSPVKSKYKRNMIFAVMYVSNIVMR